MKNPILRFLLGESRIKYLRNVILSARKDVDRHVYTEAVVKDDFSTEVYISVDGTRIAQITDHIPSDHRPTVTPESAGDIIDYIKNRYFRAHKDELYARC